MSQDAKGFLQALGKDDDDDDVPRRRRKTATATVQPPAADTPPATPAPTPSQQRAAERRQRVEDVVVPGVPTGPLTRPQQPEPVHKTSVDLRWTLKQGLQTLCDRDRRGPKAELNDALEAWLLAKGIQVEPWKG